MGPPPPSLGSTLALSLPVLAGLFTGAVASWDHFAILGANPSLESSLILLASKRVVVVRCRDSGPLEMEV